MEEDNAYLKLSIQDRCQHKLWRARVSGYEEAAKLFGKQDDEKSAEFQKYVGLLKKFVIDSNAAAQEKGMTAVLAYMENAAVASKTVNDIMSGLINKGFASPRTKTRELALEITLMCIEIEKQDVVLEELNKGFENKLPKVVTACIFALREALHLFGAQVFSLKPLIKALPKLLDDKDNNVRDETKRLCVELYRWLGEALKSQLLSVKPITMSELEAEFQKVAGERVIPTRHLKSQKEKIAKATESNTNEAEDVAVASLIDPFDSMTEVDVLSKLPKNFYEQCEAKNWQERKKALEILLQLTTNVKLETGDYGSLIRTIQKFIKKDNNVVVAGLAVKCLTNLALGLRKKFQPYTSVCIPAVFEKFKEKKQNIVASLREAIDTLFSISTFEAMIENIQAALDNKNPAIRVETCKFLARAFATCSPVQLNKKLLKTFSASLLKTLNDMDAVVRENSAEALGIALKVVGEKVMTPFLEGVDVVKMAKIKDFSDKAVQEGQTQMNVEKKLVAAPKIEQVLVQTPVGTVKNTSARPLKNKSSTTRPARSRVNTKLPVENKTHEFKEQEISDEDLLAQGSQILSEKIISDLGSSDWKDRLAAVQKFSETVEALAKADLKTQVLIKMLSRKPGFKDNNFQILKLRFEILIAIANNAQISQIAVSSCLSDVVDKIGDTKSGIYAALALTALAEATSLEYISLEVIILAFNQRNPKNQSEALVWLSDAIKQFGLKIHVKKVIDNARKGLLSTNTTVRMAAIALIGTMYTYVGESLRSYFENDKPPLLQLIDSEFKKMKGVKPPAPEKGKQSNAEGPEYEESSDCLVSLKPAFTAKVISQLEKLNQNLPVTATTPPEESIVSPSEHLSLSKTPANEEKITSKLNKSTSKSKLALKSPAVSSNIPSIKATSPSNLNTAYSVPEDANVSQASTSASRPFSGLLKLETDNIKQMFRQKGAEVHVPGLIHVDADDILNLPDIQLPQTRWQPHAASLKSLNSGDDTVVNRIMEQLAAHDLPVVIQAFAQMKEVLKSDQAAKILNTRVDEVLGRGVIQCRYARNKYMGDENICKADVVSLYGSIIVALASLFDNPVLSKKATRDVLIDLIFHLITVLLDNRLSDLQEGDQVGNMVNVLILRILEKANSTSMFSALIKLLHDCVSDVNVSDKFTELVMKCIWKMIRKIRLFINDLNIDTILFDIHVFLKEFPSSTWKGRPDTPLRTIKTVMYKLVEVKNKDIMKHLSLIPDIQNSNILQYLQKSLVNVNDKRKMSNQNTPTDSHQKLYKSSPLQLPKSIPEALTDIFRKIGSTKETAEGIAELYEFTQNHPEADIEPYLRTSSDFFQSYIRQGIQELKEKDSAKSNLKPLVMTKQFEATTTCTAGDSNLSGTDASFTKVSAHPQFCVDKFPPLPSCNTDTVLIDLVEWLKAVVAQLGMDTSRYNDPMFLNKIKGNKGSLTEKEIAQIFNDFQKYHKVMEAFKNRID